MIEYQIPGGRLVRVREEPDINKRRAKCKECGERLEKGEGYGIWGYGSARATGAGISYFCSEHYAFYVGIASLVWPWSDALAPLKKWIKENVVLDAHTIYWIENGNMVKSGIHCLAVAKALVEELPKSGLTGHRELLDLGDEIMERVIAETPVESLDVPGWVK